MSDENEGGLVELLPCPFCGSQPKLETHSQYHSYSAREAQQDGMGYSAGGFSTTSWSVDCACGISVPGNNDAFLVQRWNTRALSAHGQPVVDGVPPEAVEVEGTSLLAGAVKLGDWAIPTQCGARIVDARMAYGWNECRKAMLEAIAALTGATP